MRLSLPLLALVPSLALAQVAPSAQTQPLTGGLTAANDTALFVFPDGGAMVLATNQFMTSISGLFAYDLSGAYLDSNNNGPAVATDVRYGFNEANRAGDIMLQVLSSGVIMLHSPDSDGLLLELPISAGTNITPSSGALGWHGGDLFVFVGGSAGHLQQWVFHDSGTAYSLTKVRELTVPGSRIVYALRADELSDRLFVSVAGLGIATLPLDPDGGSTLTVFDPADGGQVGSAPRGLALYPQSDGGALLLAADHTGGRIVVFDHRGAFISSFNVVAGGGITGITQPDGLAVVPGPVGSFTNGVLAVVDPANGAGVNPNVKLINWAGAAQASTPPLPVDPSFDIRALPHGGPIDGGGGGGGGGGCPTDGGADGGDGGSTCDGGGGGAGGGGGSGGAGGSGTIPSGSGGTPEPRCGCSADGALWGLGGLMLLAVWRKRDKR